MSVQSHSGTASGSGSGPSSGSPAEEHSASGSNLVITRTVDVDVDGPLLSTNKQQVPSVIIDGDGMTAHHEHDFAISSTPTPPDRESNGHSQSVSPQNGRVHSPQSGRNGVNESKSYRRDYRHHTTSNHNASRRHNGYRRGGGRGVGVHSPNNRGGPGRGPHSNWHRPLRSIPHSHSQHPHPLQSAVNSVNLNAVSSKSPSSMSRDAETKRLHQMLLHQLSQQTHSQSPYVLLCFVLVIPNGTQSVANILAPNCLFCGGAHGHAQGSWDSVQFGSVCNGAS